MDRRTLLQAFGISSAMLMLPARTLANGRVAFAKTGENRFAYSSEMQARGTPCKVTSEDTERKRLRPPK